MFEMLTKAYHLEKLVVSVLVAVLLLLLFGSWPSAQSVAAVSAAKTELEKSMGHIIS